MNSNVMLLALELADLLFPAGMALLVTVLLRMMLKKRRRENRRRQTNPVLHPTEKALTSATLAPLHPREVELHDALREIRADVSTRIGLLLQHTLAARAEADRLEATIAHARKLGLSATGDTLAALEAALEAAGGPDGATQLDAALAQLSAALLPAIRPGDRAAIFRLAEEGQTAGSIARELEIPQGDVELLLQLGPAAPLS